MVTVRVLGNRGMLGRVVEERWRQLGATVVYDGTAHYTVNCIRPDDLAVTGSVLHGLISPSTDAIGEDSDYARTKREVEAVGGVVLRCGIVDVDRQPTHAYINWRCNPLTPLEWANEAWDRKDQPGIHALGREVVSRFDVADDVALLWDRPRPWAMLGDTSSDRVMVDPIRRPKLHDALRLYKDWLNDIAEHDRLVAGHA